MKVAMRIATGLCAFLAVAGIALGVTSDEWRGVVMLLVCSVAFLYIALVLRGSLRRAAEPAVEAEAEEEPHVGPTIWPFVGSLAAVLLVIGAVAAHWILIPGIILFIGAAAGWFLDIERQWLPGELAAAHAGASGTGASAAASPPAGSALEDQDHPDEDDRH